jgi:hypothetical protein
MLMADLDTEDLMARVKLGTLSDGELDRVAVALEQGAGRDTYKLLYVLGRSFSRRHEDVIASFLKFSEDAQVAGLAISILCTQWKLGGKYREILETFLRGAEWDILDEAKVAAMTAAGEYLRDTVDCPIFLALLSIARSESGGLNGRFAAEALARALGESHADSVPPPGVSADTWIGRMVTRAEQRFGAECKDT